MAGLPRRNFAAGDIVIREGDANENVLLIVAGRVTVYRGAGALRFAVSTLAAGDCFGEVSALSGRQASATLEADEAVVVAILDLRILTPEARGLVSANLARILAERLAHATDVMQRKHEERAAAMHLQLESSVYAAKMLLGLSTYTLLMPVSTLLKPYVPIESLISSFFIVLFFGLAWTFVTRVSNGFAEYGMAAANWPRALGRGVWLTLPLLAGATGAKAIYVGLNPGRTLFEPLLLLNEVPGAGPAHWAAFALAYIGLSFAQEFIRCATQGSLATYLRAGGVRDGWKSIAISSVVFAAVHVHVSGRFALLALGAGLLWGWMYQRERSYWTVAASHSVTGLWVLFALGVPA